MRLSHFVYKIKVVLNLAKFHGRDIDSKEFLLAVVRPNRPTDMSGCEIVALVLGVFGIAGPLQFVTKSVINTTKSSASFQAFIKETQAKTIMYKNWYLDLCSTL